MAVLAWAEKHADGDLVRKLGQIILQRLMEAKIESRRGARGGTSVALSVCNTGTATAGERSRRV